MYQTCQQSSRNRSSSEPNLSTVNSTNNLENIINANTITGSESAVNDSEIGIKSDDMMVDSDIPTTSHVSIKNINIVSLFEYFQYSICGPKILWFIENIEKISIYFFNKFKYIWQKNYLKNTMQL